MNNVTLVGRLTRNLELKKTTSVKSVTSFTLAVGRNENTQFIDCVAWNNTAELLCAYCSKGTMIGVNGSITTRTYERQDGTKAKVTEVMVREVEFLSKKSETKPSEEFKNDQAYEVEFTDNDLPF